MEGPDMRVETLEMSFIRRVYRSACIWAPDDVALASSSIEKRASALAMV